MSGWAVESSSSQEADGGRAWERVLVGGSLLFALVVQSAFFARSGWMLGDLAYHRGVAYTMGAGHFQGEGPYAGLITYYGGLYSLGVGVVTATFDVTFDLVVSIASWFGGPAWVVAVYLLGRRLWPGDRLAGAVFVVLSTIAVPFSRESDILWVESTLASSQAYWPVYPRDIALMLMALVAASTLDTARRRRVVVSGVLIGLMVLFHLQLAIVTGLLVAALSGWRFLREGRRDVWLDVAVIALIALAISSWWWIPRVGPTLASDGLLLADHASRLPLRLAGPNLLTAMGVVGVFGILGFSLVLAQPFRSPGSTLVTVWAAALLALIVLDRTFNGLELLTERRLWLLLSVPATAAAAAGLVALGRLLPRVATVALAVAVAVSLVPGTIATVTQIRTEWIDGVVGGRTYDAGVWRPLWRELAARVRADGGLVVGTYDTYATWTWSFTGAQVASLWLPGPFKLGFDPEKLTGLGFLERTALLEAGFRGREAACTTLVPAGVRAFLLDRRAGLVALHDITPAMRYRTDPRVRAETPTIREVGPGVIYEDRNAFDVLYLQAGASWAVDWADAGIRQVVIEADTAGRASAFEVRVGDRTVEIGGPAGRHQYVIDTPTGVTDISVLALRPTRLYRVSGFSPASDLPGPDGPVLVDAGTLCP